MKNIFLIPTDKSSSIWINYVVKRLIYGQFTSNDDKINCQNQNVYITSDSKFVRDEYITDGIEVMKATPKLVDAQGLVDRRNWRKIVLTNDLELIKDGIQEIEDLFLVWFVKNPTFDEIEIGKTNKLIDNYADEEKEKWEVKYHIYIPKKNFYCGDEVDYGEQCDFQCDRCVDATGVDYGYLPKETPKFVSKTSCSFINKGVRIKEEKVYNDVFHYQTRWLFDWLSKNDYLTDDKEVLQKEFEEYLKK
jgi:hypothetical protein